MNSDGSKVDFKYLAPVRGIRDHHAQHASILQRLLVTIDCLMFVALRLYDGKPPTAMA